MQAIAQLLPPTYVFEGMRTVLAGSFSVSNALIGLALSCMYLLGTYYIFSWVYRIVIRNGQIARYSAESI